MKKSDSDIFMELEYGIAYAPLPNVKELIQAAIDDYKEVRQDHSIWATLKIGIIGSYQFIQDIWRLRRINKALETYQGVINFDSQEGGFVVLEHKFNNIDDAVKAAKMKVFL